MRCMSKLLPLKVELVTDTLPQCEGGGERNRNRAVMSLGILRERPPAL